MREQQLIALFDEVQQGRHQSARVFQLVQPYGVQWDGADFNADPTGADRVD